MITTAIPKTRASAARAMGGWHTMRAAALIIAGLAIVTLGLFDGLDRLSAQQPAMERAVPDPLRARSNRAVAQRALSIGEPDQAAHAARAALRSDPMDRRNLGLLGLAYFETGNRAQAEAVFRQASQLGWREPLTQFFWFEASLRAADLPSAMVRLDALMRSNPTSSEAQRALAMVSSVGPGRAQLAELLVAKPDWLRVVLEVPGQLPASRVLDRAALVVRMGQNGALLGCDRPRILADRLLDDGQWNAARQVWNLHCPEQSVAQHLADPAFASLRDGAVAGPFGWQRVASGDLDVSTRKDGAIAIRNSGPRRTIVATQRVAWARGQVRLSLPDAAPGQFAFGLRCGGPDGAGSGIAGLSADGDPALGGQLLTVPDCPNQILSLLASPANEPARLGSVRFNKR